MGIALTTALCLAALLSIVIAIRKRRQNQVAESRENQVRMIHLVALEQQWDAPSYEYNGTILRFEGRSPMLGSLPAVSKTLSSDDNMPKTPSRLAATAGSTKQKADGLSVRIPHLTMPSSRALHDD